MKIVAFCSLSVFIAAAAAAQPAIVGYDPAKPLTATLDADRLRELPTGESLFTLLETSQPSTIADRFSNGGLSFGQPARVGGFFGSPSQTVYRIGDVTITDPTGTGFPLAYPDLLLWQRIDITTGLMPADFNVLGLGVTFSPLEPTKSWVRTIDGLFSHGGMNAGARPAGDPPAIQRLGGWDRIAGTASGPISSSIGGVFTGAWTRSTEYARGAAQAGENEVASATASLVFTRSGGDVIKTFGWFSNSNVPFALADQFNAPDAQSSARTIHGQASWERGGSWSKRLFGGYTDQHRESSSEVLTAAGFERLSDGPLSQVSELGTYDVRQWSLGGRMTASQPIRRVHHLQAGFDFSGAHSTHSDGFAGNVGERVNNLPARLWVFTPALDSHRSETTAGAYLSDLIELSPSVRVEASVRFDGAWGSARDAANGIGWGTFLPKGVLYWNAKDNGHFDFFVGLDRRAYRLPLDILAVGDPAESTANVYRTDALAAGPPGSAFVPLVARVGPGTGGDPGFSMIDPDLDRPVTDEFAIGFSSRLPLAIELRVVGVARRQHDALGLVNTGVPASSYTVIQVPDIGSDELNPEDDEVLSIYNRIPASFGLDRYVLTNPDQDPAHSESLEMTVQMNRRLVAVFLGATASITDGAAASRGYGPLENDEGILGEVFTTPNASGHERSRLFTDRAFTARVSTVFKLPAQTTFGMIVRYQDGQPFSRAVVMTGLNQGTDFVPAFTNGRSRFYFTGTLDARLQKTFTSGRVEVTGIFDAFNPLGRAYEVEENVANGANYRAITAVQPPRALRLGVRLVF